MGSKLGIHVNVPEDENRYVEFCRVAKPAAVLHLDLGNTSFPRRVKEVSPNTLIIGRKWFASQPLDNPESRADRAVGAMLDSSCGREGLIDVWVVYNEIGPHITHDYMRFDMRAMQRLHEANQKGAVGNWSVGTPDIYDWYSGWFHETLRVADYLAIHEYCAPAMDSPRGLDAANPGEGWFTLRYRKMMRALREQNLGFSIPPLLITECGIDSGAAHWDPGAQGGWRSFASPQEYLRQLKWYDSYLQGDDYVAGAATIFCCGTHDPTWDSFDVQGEMLDLLQNYLVEEQQGDDIIIPHPDWLMDLRHILPRHVTKTYSRRSLANVTQVVIHHSAVAPTVGPWQIAEYHVGVKDWPGHGYHADIAMDGRVWQCQDWETWSYHAGAVNPTSIGICLLGNFMGGSEPTDAQIETARKLISHLEQVVGHDLEVVGHREVMDNRDCPGDSFLGGWKQRLLDGVEPEPDWEEMYHAVQERYEAEVAESGRLSTLLADIEELAKER